MEKDSEPTMRKLLGFCCVYYIALLATGFTLGRALVKQGSILDQYEMISLKDNN